MDSPIGEEVAHAVNGFAPTSEGDAWITGVYAPSLGIIATAFAEATGHRRDGAICSQFAGTVLARLAQHDPPIGVERIR